MTDKIAIMKKLLTKSRYVCGVRCLKYLWVLCNNKKMISEPSEAQQARMSEGTRVGELAKKIYPDGIDIPAEHFDENLETTRDMMSRRIPLFEAGFLSGRSYSRVDILVPADNDSWDIIEVKSSSRVKEDHIQDLAFQKQTLDSAGIKVNRCFLMHVNKNYFKQGDIDPSALMTSEDVTVQVEGLSEEVKTRSEEMLDIIDMDDMPDVPVGTYCNRPYECPLKSFCWKEMPEGNVFELRMGGQKAESLAFDDICLLKDIPDEFKLTKKQQIQKDCAITGKPHVETDKISEFLDDLKEPVVYLDFETFATAIPIYDGTNPYKKIPFQFSLHIDSGDGFSHKGFLASGKDDPRSAFLDALRVALKNSGYRSIVVFHQAFEKSILKECAEAFPEQAGWIKDALACIVDLEKPFADFNYYHPSQCGKTSIKKILPVLTGKGYEDMSIADGDSASISFLKAEHWVVSDPERISIRENLEKYCELDTIAMKWIIDELRKK